MPANEMHDPLDPKNQIPDKTGAAADSEPVFAQSSIANAVEDARNLLNEHKGKLTLGVAATLGLVILYNWREKWMAKEDPEAYAQLQKFTAPFKSAEEIEQEEFERRCLQESRQGVDGACRDELEPGGRI